jgi:hypothetical protein
MDEAMQGSCCVAAAYFRLHRKSLLAVYGGDASRFGRAMDLVLVQMANIRQMGMSATAAIACECLASIPLTWPRPFP